MNTAIKRNLISNVNNYYLMSYICRGCKEECAAHIKEIFQKAGKEQLDIVIDAAEKTLIPAAGPDMALQYADILAEHFVLGVYYSPKEEALYLELISRLEHFPVGRQMIA